MEHPPNLEKREPSESAPINRLESAVKKIEEHAEVLGESGSDTDSSEQSVEKITKKVGRIRSLLNAASIVVSLMGAYEAGSYTTSRYEITAKAGPNGKTEYEHEDPETTRIMEFLTGAKELAPEDRIHFYQQVARNANRDLMTVNNENQGIDAQAIFERNLPSDEQGLRELLRGIYTKYEAIYGKSEGEIESRIDKEFAKSIKQPTQYDPVIEKMVWDMQTKVGAPRIRWSAPGDNIHSKVMGHIAGPGRANYDPSSNTVYLTPGSDNETLGELLVAEDAHALQFNKYPIQSRARYIVDISYAVLRAVREQKSVHAAQYEDYITPGTMEYEAHKEIEPNLIKEAIESTGTRGDGGNGVAIKKPPSEGRLIISP